MTSNVSTPLTSAIRPTIQSNGRAAGTIRWAAVVVAAAALGAVSAAGAQEVSPPVPREQPQPDIPEHQFGFPIEGWVKVRYTVLADGSTAEVRVVEALPPNLPTKDAESAVEDWIFAPATAGGEPVDWHNNESLIIFDAEEIPLEPSPFFAEGYAEIIELIDDEAFDKALTQNRILNTRAVRLNEIAIAQVQASALHAATSNPHEAYAAILRATDARVPSLNEEDLANALRHRFALAVELGHFKDALDTHERLEEITPAADDDPIVAQAEQIRQALEDGEAAVLVQGRVDRDAWSYAPMWRTFTLTDVDGTVRGIELDCERRKAELEYAPESEWSVPESWGACTIFVDARRNTSFSLVEFP